ncbi:hypothetical protein F4779DRAFT_639534 [Xylariaceae sp. FL0662B]|nr:hypothetical protein F4779DRAFT_639534 [Xylariaceae sp. FL0662B]
MLRAHANQLSDISTLRESINIRSRSRSQCHIAFQIHLADPFGDGTNFTPSYQLAVQRYDEHNHSGNGAYGYLVSSVESLQGIISMRSSHSLTRAAWMSLLRVTPRKTPRSGVNTTLDEHDVVARSLVRLASRPPTSCFLGPMTQTRIYILVVFFARLNIHLLTVIIWQEFHLISFPAYYHYNDLTMAPDSRVDSQISLRDMEVLAKVWQCFESEPKINWEKLAEVADFPDAMAAKACFTYFLGVREDAVREPDGTPKHTYATTPDPTVNRPFYSPASQTQVLDWRRDISPHRRYGWSDDD